MAPLNNSNRYYSDSEIDVGSDTQETKAFLTEIDTGSQQRRKTGLFLGVLLVLSVLVSVGLVMSQRVRDNRKPLVSIMRSPYYPKTLPAQYNHCYCGKTIEEAHGLNCIYDTLATAWLPPYCRDDELTKEFDKAGPGPNGEWGYFKDINGTIPLNKEQIGILGETGTTFYASWSWHVAHCLFYWQKYIRMRDTSAVMEERFDSLGHTKHCGRLVTLQVPEGQSLLQVTVLMNSSMANHKEVALRAGLEIGGHMGHT